MGNRRPGGVCSFFACHYALRIALMPDQPCQPHSNAAVPAAVLALAVLLSLASCGATLSEDSDAEAKGSAQGHGDAAAAVRPAPPPPSPPVHGGAEGQQDDSVRCRLSGICEGKHPGCAQAADVTDGGNVEGAPDPLACLTSAGARAEAVQEAARHAWQGYRCALPACSQLQGSFARRLLACSQIC
jgi:hypothetical protein